MRDLGADDAARPRRGNQLPHRIKEGQVRVETAMGAIGAVFQPELIELMKAVLDDAAATLPEAKRTSTMKAEIASHILAYAAKGERNPTALPSWSVVTIRTISLRSAGQSEE